MQQFHHITVSQITEEQEIITLHQTYQLPLSCQGKTQTGFCVLEAKIVWEEEEIGLISGNYDTTQKEMWILMIFLSKEYRTQENTRITIEQFAKLSREIYEVKRFLWRYSIEGQGLDPYEKLFRDWQAFEWSKHIICEEYIVDFTKIRNHPHHRASYGIEKIEEKGYTLIPWNQGRKSKCDYFEALKAARSSEPEFIELLPLVGEDYCKEESFLLEDKEQHQVAGWMICRKIAEKEIEIRRWYTLEEYRESGIGRQFGAYMLQRLEQKFDRLHFYVKENNDSMNQFAKVYFGKGIIKIIETCYMEFI